MVNWVLVGMNPAVFIASQGWNEPTFLANSTLLKSEEGMGLSNFHGPAGGVLPVLVMSMVYLVALLKNMVTSVIQTMCYNESTHVEEDHPPNGGSPLMSEIDATARRGRRRRVSIRRFELMCNNRSNLDAVNGSGNAWCSTECCVCLCGFEMGEEVSELVCRHIFHKSCLDKWFAKLHTACPLCRSTV